jgi:hypothetical protein
MAKKILGITMMLLVIGIGSVFAQSSQSSENLVKRLESLAGRWETMARKTSSLNSWTRIQQKEVDSLEDDSSSLNTDIQYAGYGDIQFNDGQSKRLREASRRIENAKSQIQRNIARLERDY